MSDDRHPSDAGAGTGHGDTPREGTPAFDEIDPARPPAPPTAAVIDARTDAAHRKDTLQMNRRANVTLPDGVIGPAPDHASAYVPPHAAPKPASHKTLEVDLVRVDTRPDPRRAAQTQKLPRIPERNPSDIDTVPEGLRVLPDGDADNDATDPDLAAPPSRTSSMGGLITIALLAFAAVFVVGILLFKVMARPSTDAIPTVTEATPPTPAPLPAPTAPTAPTVRTATPSTETATPSETAEPPVSAEPSNSAPPATGAATKPAPQTTKSGQTEVKSPSTSAPGTAEPINN